MPASRLIALNLLTVSIVAIAAAFAFAQDPGYVPKEGFVPDEKTAITITEAILAPIYGQEQVAFERPFHASLNSDGVWTIKGSLPKGYLGGVATVRIQKQNGQILYVTHTK